MGEARIYVAHGDDSVGTVLGRRLRAGEAAPLTDRGEVSHATIVARDDVPVGHKIALTQLEAGSRVLKYGYPIGRAVEAIERGQHVHVHNIESERGRGDLAEDRREQG